MNTLGFLDLLREIFYAKEVNIKKIQRKGLLAVKIGQTFALRIDFLDEAKCIKLSELFNNTEKIPEENVNSLIDKYVGRKWLNNFKFFDKKCFASASIGQVHNGFLKSGEKVAVKIIKKDFKEVFKKDVESVLRLFKFIIKIYPKLAKVADPIGVLNSIKEFTLDELDLRNESKNRDLLFKIYKEHKDKVDLKNLKFIEVYKRISSENIMVSKFIEGETFDKKLTDGTLSYDMLLELFHIHGFFIFGVGTFHGDIHPGNIIFCKKNIYFVDCGAIGRVNNKMRKDYFHLWRLFLYEYDKCAFYLNKMSEVELTGEKYEKFRVKMLELYKDFTNKTVSEDSLTKKMMETIKLGVNSGMQFEKGMFPVIKSLMYLDGMVLRCNPNAILMKDMRKYIEELRKYV